MFKVNKIKTIKPSNFFQYKEKKVLKGWRIVTVKELIRPRVLGAENNGYEIMKRKTERLIRLFDNLGI